MMPQPRDRLVHVLFLWITILTMILVTFIITFYCTAGHRAPPPEPGGRPNKTLPLGKEPDFVSGTTLTFTATANEQDKVGRIKWSGKPHTLVKVNKTNLTIGEDGFYFLYLQVTLETEETVDRTYVSLWRENNVFLQGMVSTLTHSTGLLGMAKRLSAGENLKVTIHPPANINKTDAVTHLGIIYLEK